VAAWMEDRDEPGTYEGTYRPLRVHGHNVVSRYRQLGSNWLVRLGDRTRWSHPSGSIT
jgi:hypothetical protein